MEAMRPLKSDRRILRSQRALREALVAELSLSLIHIYPQAEATRVLLGKVDWDA